MIGYWVVIALVAGALLLVVVAGAGEEPGERRPVPRVPTQKRPVWAALGASDLTGEGTPAPERDNWAAQLAAALPVEVTLLNLGVGGSTLAQARREQLPAALAAKPDLVSCWLAVNDVAAGVPLPTYERELALLLRASRDAGSSTVVGNVPDLARVPALASGSGAALRHTAEQWNAVIARLAAAHGAEVVDLFAEAAAAEDFGPDGFHPSPTGHRRLAARFRPPVERALSIEATPPEGGDRPPAME